MRETNGERSYKKNIREDRSQGRKTKWKKKKKRKGVEGGLEREQSKGKGCNTSSSREG